MTNDPAGKSVLVTGANRGIGLALSHAFMQAGAAKLYAAVRDLDSAKPLVEKYGDKVQPIALDLTKRETLSLASSAAADAHIVINNGGILLPDDTYSTEIFDNLDRHIDVNVKGMLRMAQVFIPIIKRNGGGAFVQLNSVASLRNFSKFTTYCASKAASYSLTQGLRDMVADDPIQVLSVHPGPIKTDMGDQAGFEEAPPPSVVADAVIASLKAGDFHCFPDDMAKQIWENYQGFARSVIEPAMQEA